MSPGKSPALRGSQGSPCTWKEGSQSSEERKGAELALCPVRAVLSTTSHTRMLGNAMEHVFRSCVQISSNIFSRNIFLNCQIQVLKLKHKKHYKKKGFPGKESTRNAGDLGWVGKIPWRREQLPTPVFWPGEVLYSPWGPKGLATIERFSLLHFIRRVFAFKISKLMP